MKVTEFRNRIEAYLSSARHCFLRPEKPTDAFFLSQNGSRLSARTIQKLLGRYTQELGLPAYTPHSFRHGAATRFLHYGVDLKTISEILGHASAAITAAVYLHTDERKKADAIAQVLYGAYEAAA